MLQELLLSAGLGWNDIGAFAVATGPGSFTGLRVACATMAGINASLKKPVYRIDSLEIVARQSDVAEPLWAIEDARSGLVYAAQYQQGKNLEPARCIRWQEFAELEPKRYISSGEIPETLDGWQKLNVISSREKALEALVRTIQPEDEHDLWLVPVYLQVSQAEKNFL